jgi:hypothetical protein
VSVALTGELDLAAAARADLELREAGAQAEFVVWDLRDLTFVDCAGLWLCALRARWCERSVGGWSLFTSLRRRAACSVSPARASGCGSGGTRPPGISAAACAPYGPGVWRWVTAMLGERHPDAGYPFAYLAASVQLIAAAGKHDLSAAQEIEKQNPRPPAPEERGIKCLRA